MANLTPVQIQAIIAKLRATEGPSTRPVMPVDPLTEHNANAALDAYRARYGDSHKNAQIRFSGN